MARLFVPQLIMSLLVSSTLAYGAQTAGSYVWTDEQMGKTGLPPGSGGATIDLDLLPGTASCGRPKCKFSLHYFKGANFDARRKTKTILYIAGGPGQIVPRTPPERRPLFHHEKDHNVIYLDIRGAGLSAIDGDNSYDTFLRSDYIINDIEKLRERELGSAIPWDAIYAHSAGTVTAHKYAAKFEAAKVSRLILSAPVSRRANTELDHISMILKNLDRIYQTYSTRPCLIATVDAFWRLITLRSDERLDDDFCFLTQDQRKNIRRALLELLTEIQTSYGSINFVTQNIKDLTKKDPNFKTGEKYPYPEAFFNAVKVLEMSGAPVEGLTYNNSIKNEQIDAALMIGYYLSLDRDGRLLRPQSACSVDVSFFRRITDVIGNRLKKDYCARIDKKKDSLFKDPIIRSERANEVLGVYDGVSRSVFAMLNSTAQCFRGKDLISFARSTGATMSVVAKEEAEKIGVIPEEEYCPWDPTKPQFKHGVPTLILKGGADPVIAGCQAEDYFNNGLTGQRGLVESPGVGHLMRFPSPARRASDEPEDIKLILVNKILEVPPDKLLTVSNRKDFLETLKPNEAIKFMADGLGASPIVCNIKKVLDDQ